MVGGSERTRSSGYSIFRTAYPVEHAIGDEVVWKGFPMLENGGFTTEMWYGYDLALKPLADDRLLTTKFIDQTLILLFGGVQKCSLEH